MLEEYSTNTSTHERLSSVESDVRHLDNRLQTLDRNMQDNFSGIRALITQQKQPITAFAGWAAVILSLVFAFGAPLKSVDHRLRDRIDELESRELQDSYFRGMSEQTFKTLEEEIASSVMNRKDIDAKHVSTQESLARQIRVLEHTLDNGLGTRIDEKAEGMKKDIEWLKKEIEKLQKKDK